MSTPLNPNEQLLDAAKEILQWSHLDDAREWRSDLAKLESAITAAESAPASLERELVDTLRRAMQYIARVDGPTIHEQARAVLRKYDEAKKCS